MTNKRNKESSKLTNQIESNRNRHGSERIVEEDDSDAGGDGGGEGSAGVQRPVRPPSHPSQQVPPSGVLPPMEVRERAPLLREVRVRARHGEDASDAEDPRTRGQVEAAPDSVHSSHSQNRQCLDNNQSWFVFCSNFSLICLIDLGFDSIDREFGS